MIRQCKVCDKDYPVTPGAKAEQPDENDFSTLKVENTYITRGFDPVYNLFHSVFLCSEQCLKEFKEARDEWC